MSFASQDNKLAALGKSMIKDTAFERRVFLSLFICMLIAIFLTLPKKTAEEEEFKPIVFCTLLPSSLQYAATEDPTKMVGDKNLYWNKKAKLRIYFMNGSPSVAQEVLKVANVWSTLSGIEFTQVHNIYEPSEIRISFKCPGYNSLVGRQANDPLYARKPTMCLERLDVTRDRQLFERTVLHEFGHVLGFLHELQHPQARIPWDTAKLYHYYDSVYNWKPDSVDKWVLQLYRNVDYTDFDTSSIMVYAIPEEVTKGQYAIGWPSKLSFRDSAFVKQKYH